MLSPLMPVTSKLWSLTKTTNHQLSAAKPTVAHPSLSITAVTASACQRGGHAGTTTHRPSHPTAPPGSVRCAKIRGNGCKNVDGGCVSLMVMQAG
ncbi:hypothetical protein K402DRAFT_199433 [Aulographum hederae CBS 113979]|uniref:Uncharacterized protein n=1 Tax=Aulographum hederae CBS 113979 TaxID=1176131 RepID=A0A6G1HBZ3_9PEZI|nr:hypothetical protein K402DRAFT_199433 [Aulographum hederae CBS 113979]